ncbi:MAG: hypothetical protein EOO61_07745 [Hymenobacter sp.]|nr:MAG: hypothetical protein EOO61_07745 [Hymenobacter sp.]
MIQFANTDEFLRVAANFMAKGIMVRHPNELLAINNTIHIIQDKTFISELYKRTRDELVKNLEGESSLNTKKEYLRQLQRMFSSDPLDKWLPLIDKARKELSSQIETTNPGTVSMTDALQTIAVFQVQSLCLMAIDDFTSFTNSQKMWLGHCYLIATNGDRLISELLREVSRQISLFDTETATPPNLPAINQISYNETTQSEPYDYVGLHLERARDAELHDLNITSLIKAKGYQNWWDMQEQELPRKITSGNGYQYFYYPKPYSQKYFWRFLHLIINTSFASVKTALHEQFFGDKLDRDYIEGLLLHAEHDCFLTKEGAVLIADDENELAFENPHNDWPFGTYPEAIEKFSDSVFYGGENFKQRAKLVRVWCQEMVAEEQSKHNSIDSSIPSIVNASISVEDFSQPDSTRRQRRTNIDIVALDPRDASVELEQFLINSSTRLCDILAEAVGFRPPAATRKHSAIRAFKKVGDGPTARIYAVADFLALQNLVQARKKTRLVIAMGRRLGYPNDAPENTKGNEYNTALGFIEKAFTNETNALKADKDKKQHETGSSVR